MFRSLDEARQFLDDAGLGHLADRILPHLHPCLVFNSASPDRTGGTRTGGVPDLPPGLDWPVRPVPANAEGIANLGGSNHSEWIARHLSVPLPYEFLAQIDLAGVARHPGSAGLPTSGRLLFFYDGAVGPWGDTRSAGRVLFDPSPVAALTPAPVPAALAALAATERGEHDRMQADPMEMAKSFLPEQLKIISGTLKPGETLEDHFRSIVQSISFSSRYLHPAQPMTIERALQWPGQGSPEATASPELGSPVERGTIDSIMERPDFNAPPATSRHVFLGIPIAEQDDARYDAVFITDPDLQKRLNADRPTVWPEVEARAAEWRLLLQIDQSALMADRFVEGMIYFVIRRDDLSRRDFSRVLTIYQQT